MLFICYPKCSTCQKATKYLESHGCSFTLRDISAEPPTAEELAAWQARSGLPLRRFFNTSGQRYRALDLARRLPEMDEAAQRALLATDGMLVKRPILVTDRAVLVGFRETEWAEALR